MIKYSLNPITDTESSKDDSDTLMEQSPASNSQRWSKCEEKRLVEAVQLHGIKNWIAVSEHVTSKNNGWFVTFTCYYNRYMIPYLHFDDVITAQCRQRWLKCSNPTITKGRWTEKEDNMLISFMEETHHTWKQASEKIPGRTSKLCRDRWNNYLCPDVNKSPFSEEEDRLLMRLYQSYGKHWAKISQVGAIYANVQCMYI
jgi:Myb-like DNA-binding domain